jgi:hypothetical protein
VNLPPNQSREGYLLLLFDVPDRLGGLVSRLGFKQSKKIPTNWWRRFDPQRDGERAKAEKIRDQLKKAGLRGKWRKIELPPATQPNASLKNDSRPQQRGGNWNSGITARPRYGGRGHRRGSGW